MPSAWIPCQHQVLTLLAMLALAAPAAGQSTTATEADRKPQTSPTHPVTYQQSALVDEISGGFVGGPGWFEPGPLEDRLRAHGFEDLHPYCMLIGVTGRVIFDSGLTLGAAAAMAGHDAADGPAAYDARLTYSMLRAEVGYALLSSARWLLAPKLALGGYSATLTLTDDRNATFDELLESPGTMTSVSSTGLLTGVLLDSAVRFSPGRAEPAARGFFSVGLEGGYLFSVPFGRWSSATGGEVDEGPDVPLTGFFVGLTVGGGAYAL